MFKYCKLSWFPINIIKKDLKLAKVITTQYGGPYGELGAALRYLNQRYTMPDDKGKALLTDIGTEELGHVEMICAMFYQLTKGASIEEMKAAGLDLNYSQHGKEIFMTDSFGNPFNVANIGATGDALADLSEDMAAEEKARATYEHLMNMTNDPDLLAPLSFLRQREVVHFNRFKELRDYYLDKYKKNTKF
jgi:spore coat protein JC